MIWQKNIYDSLISCATLCDEFATECSQKNDIENWYRSIFLTLDCADMCRQLAMLYVRGSENTRLLAKICIEICSKCAQEVSKSNSRRCDQVYACCEQTIADCLGMLETAQESESLMMPGTAVSASLFYGIDLRETIYN